MACAVAPRIRSVLATTHRAPSYEIGSKVRARRAPRLRSASGDCRHHLAGEALHRAQHPLLLQVAEPEAAVEVRDPHQLLQSPDMADTGIGRADHQEVLEEVL